MFALLLAWLSILRIANTAPEREASIWPSLLLNVLSDCFRATGEGHDLRKVSQLSAKFSPRG